MKTLKIILGAVVLFAIVGLTAIKKKDKYSKLEGGLTKTESPIVIE